VAHWKAYYWSPLLTVPLADLVSQYHAIRSEIDAAVHNVFESGQFILGSYVEDLERLVAEVSGAAYAVGVNSGTDALLLGLAALGIGPGDEVITTPFTFVATVEAICHLGARPVFADIIPRTFNLDPDDARRRITARTRAILPVDLFGQPADRAAYQQLAQEHGLQVLYDSAQAIGARYDGMPLGAFGDALTLSFFPTKNLGAYGDAGMVLTNREDVRDRVRMLRFHGSDGGYEYDHVGYCSRLDALQAAILQVKLGHLEAWTETRRAHAAAYAECLRDTECVLPSSDPRVYHVYHQFTIRHPRRDALRAYLNERGIRTGVYYPSPLHLQKAYRHLGYVPGDFPEAERACREVASLPVHPEMTEEQQQYVCRTIVELHNRS